MLPAEVILMARQTGGNPPETIPEERYLEPPTKPEIGLALAATGVLAGLAVAAWAGTRVGRKASA